MAITAIVSETVEAGPLRLTANYSSAGLMLTIEGPDVHAVLKEIDTTQFLAALTTLVQTKRPASL